MVPIKRLFSSIAEFAFTEGRVRASEKGTTHAARRCTDTELQMRGCLDEIHPADGGGEKRWYVPEENVPSSLSLLYLSQLSKGIEPGDGCIKHALNVLVLGALHQVGSSV